MDKILFGDRIFREITENESKVLKELIKEPTNKLIYISDSTNIPIKSVINIKKSLEKRNIIKGYTAILDFSKLNINRQIIFLRFSSEGISEIDKFADYVKYNKKIVKFFKIIGEFQIAIEIESLDETELLKDIRSNYSIENYLIFKSEKIHKKTYLPID